MSIQGQPFLEAHGLVGGVEGEAEVRWKLDKLSRPNFVARPVEKLLRVLPALAEVFRRKEVEEVGQVLHRGQRPRGRRGALEGESSAGQVSLADFGRSLGPIEAIQI